MLGAIDACRLIGLLFAFDFAGLGSRDGLSQGAANEASNRDYLAVGSGTLTTLGSNLVPTRSVVLTVAPLEAVLGQIPLVAVIARLVAWWAALPSPSDE